MSECSRYETECVMCDCQPDVRGYPGDIWGMFAISDCHLRVPWLSISRSAQLSHIVSHTTKDRTKADSACFAPSCHVIILHISQPGRETPAVFAAARRDEKKALSLSGLSRESGMEMYSKFEGIVLKSSLFAKCSVLLVGSMRRWYYQMLGRYTNKIDVIIWTSTKLFLSNNLNRHNNKWTFHYLDI